MNNKTIILIARVMSMTFTPFYLPSLGLLILFFFTYMGLMPTRYKLLVFGTVYLFTILLPTVLIHVYQHWQGWSPIELGTKERRMVPYTISILSYFVCLYLLEMQHAPTSCAASSWRRSCSRPCAPS